MLLASHKAGMAAPMLAELHTPKRNQRPDTNETIAMDLALHGRKAALLRSTSTESRS